VADPTSASGRPEATPARVRLGPDRISLIPVVFFLLGSLPLAASSPWLVWVLLLPLGCAVWVLRARVVAIPVGVEVCNGLRASRVAWTDVTGVDVPRRGPLRLLRSTGRPLLMTALARRDLPRLLAVGEAAPAGAGAGYRTAAGTGETGETGGTGRR